VVPFDRGHGLEEQARLREVVVEGAGQGTDYLTLGDWVRDLDVAAVAGGGRERAAAVEGVGVVGGYPGVHGVLVVAVAEHVVDGGVRPVDGDLLEVRATESGQLGVEVGEQPGLQQRVVGDVDPRHEVAGMEGHLLSLGEVVGGVRV